MALPCSVEVIETFQISPSPKSVPTTSVPLTFFDIPWLGCPQVSRVLFYEFPHTTLHFTQTILPKLKHSLSLTLQHYFPLAGTCVYPQQQHIKPYILYKHGESSIPLIIAEAKSGDFDHLVQNYARDVREFHPLAAELPPPLSSSTEKDTDTDTPVPVQLLHPLLAIQVTIFPNKGICINDSLHHVVCDGRAINNFFKSWASICKSESHDDLLLPLHDRENLINDPNGHLLNTTWKQLFEIHSSHAPLAAPEPDEEKVRMTFVLGRDKINKLKHWIESHLNNNNEAPPSLSPLPPPQPIYVSGFVAICAFMWVCLIKTKNNAATTVNANGGDGDDDRLYHFEFSGDCTNSKDFSVPKTYFGNCLRPCFAAIKKNEILSENGLIMAVKAIMKDVRDPNNATLTAAENWFPNILKIFSTGDVLTVAGSPKLGAYETDFGWGRPKKSEIVHIDKSGSISLTESRDEEGGVEVGLALNKAQMETFVFIFELGLKNLCLERSTKKILLFSDN